jgi:hypothetical protein
VVATCTGDALTQIRNLRRAAATASSEEGRKLNHRHTEAAAMRKEKCNDKEYKLPRNPLRGRSSLSSSRLSMPSQLQCVKTRNISNHRHHTQTGKCCGPRVVGHATGGNSENRPPFRLTAATVVQQIITELSEAASEK